jgi:hypothetical protein
VTFRAAETGAMGSIDIRSELFMCARPNARPKFYEIVAFGKLSFVTPPVLYSPPIVTGPSRTESSHKWDSKQ